MTAVAASAESDIVTAALPAGAVYVSVAEVGPLTTLAVTAPAVTLNTVAPLHKVFVPVSVMVLPVLDAGTTAGEAVILGIGVMSVAERLPIRWPVEAESGETLKPRTITWLAPG